ncbi:MAG: hypothetical protein ABIG96_03135 [Candidatus Micrarchaeota archaeon]
MRKAIFFSIDAVLALLISSVLLAATLQSLSQMESLKPSDPTLAISRDALATMEKSGILQDAVKAGSSARIRNFLEFMPENVCYRVSIFAQNSQEPVMAEENCACDEITSVARSFIAEGAEAEIYVAEMRSCIR